MNSIGKLYRVSIFGESHGPSVGVLIDGFLPGIKVDYDLIHNDLERRKPSYVGSTPRKETDEIIIESGVHEGYTTGSPILVRVLNENVVSKDYEGFINTPRPSHVDFVSNVKYKGYHNLPGSGHFSGRLSTGLVIAGSFAKMILHMKPTSTFIQVGDHKNVKDIDEYIEKIANEKDSIGATIKVTVSNMEKGLGEPFFESVESKLSALLYSIPGIKGISFGIGFDGVTLRGSQYNDVIIDKEGMTKTNHAGGINGGITNGNDLVVNVFMRPASSIGIPQQTFNMKENKMTTLEIKGRHDSFIARRALVVIENTIMIGLLDLLLEKKSRL